MLMVRNRANIDSDVLLLLIIDLLSHHLANNLYGYAQRMYMPVGEYKWVEEKEFSKIKWVKLKENSARGFIAEVTLSYPKKLHRAHASFPLAPERMEVNSDMLSPYAKGENGCCCFSFFSLTYLKFQIATKL